MITNGPSAEESSGTDHRPIADGETQSILVASDDGEILEATESEGDGKDCDCHLLPGDYPCASCYIGGDAEWPDETDADD